MRRRTLSPPWARSSSLWKTSPSTPACIARAGPQTRTPCPRRRSPRRRRSPSATRWAWTGAPRATRSPPTRPRQRPAPQPRRRPRRTTRPPVNCRPQRSPHGLLRAGPPPRKRRPRSPAPAAAECRSPTSSSRRATRWWTCRGRRDPVADLLAIGGDEASARGLRVVGDHALGASGRRQADSILEGIPMLSAPRSTDAVPPTLPGRLDRELSRRAAIGWPHPRWFAWPLGALSLTANYGILWYVISLLPWIFGEPRPLARALYVAVPVTAVEAAGFLIKRFVARPRPPIADPSQPQQIPLPFSKSFPSSHASMAVVGAFTVGALYPAALPALIALTVVLCFSRVYLGVHYLGDVLDGDDVGGVD